MSRLLSVLFVYVAGCVSADTGGCARLVVPLAEVAQTQGVLNLNALPPPPAGGPVMLVPRGLPGYMLDHRLKTPEGNVPLRHEFVPKLAVLLGQIAQELARRDGRPPDIIALADTPAHFLPDQLTQCADVLGEVLKAQHMPAIKIAIPVKGGWKIGDEFVESK